MGKDRPSPELEYSVHPRRGTDRPTARSSPPEKMSDQYKSHFPWLVPTFALINVSLFIASMYINDCPSHSTKCIAPNLLGRFSFQSIHENPLLGPAASTLQSMGALEVKKVVEDYQVWRLFTCIWLHAGVLHVLANMLSLLFVGVRLEQEFGCLRVGVLYNLAGIGGSLLSALFVPATISVGASGALFGLLGAMLSELLTNWSIYSNKLAALSTLILIITINLAVGILPHVDNFAHIGGFTSGFLLGFVILIRPQFGWVSPRNVARGYIGNSSKPKHKIYQYVLLVISMIILVVGFAVGLVLLLRGVNGNEFCSWCHYLSCVPTSKWKCESKQVYCESSQLGNQLTLTCLSNGKSKLFLLPDDNRPSDLEELCARLCSQ